MDTQRMKTINPEAFDKALGMKKHSNIIICIFIIIFGIFSIYAAVRYEGGFLISYRSIAVCSTTFVTITAVILMIVNFWESAAGKEIVSDSLYYLRLSTAAAEAVIFLIAVIEFLFDGYLPGEPFVLYRFDKAMMDVVIPALVIVSFCVNDAPVPVDKLWKRLYGALFVTLYGIGMTVLLFAGVIPENKLPFYCPNIRSMNIGLLTAQLVLTYALCFLLSGFLIRLNQKTYWLSYNVRWMNFLSSQYWDEHRTMLNVIRLVLGLPALWLIVGGLSACLQQEGSLIERSVYLFIFIYGALLAAAAVFLPVLRRAFQRFFLFRVFSLLFAASGALLLSASLLLHLFAFFVPKATGSEAYVVVLGAPVVDDRASENLRARVETAADWLLAYPNTRAILTGGKGSQGSQRTEAQVMRDLLLEAGIPDDQLIVENQASTTKENFQFSRVQIADEEVPAIAVITNEFHLFRARYHAQQAGITNLRFIPVRTPTAVRFGWFVRENITIISYIFTGKML